MRYYDANECPRYENELHPLEDEDACFAKAAPHVSKHIRRASIRCMVGIYGAAKWAIQKGTTEHKGPPLSPKNLALTSK
jgi:hypothetical protein